MLSPLKSSPSKSSPSKRKRGPAPPDGLAPALEDRLESLMDRLAMWQLLGSIEDTQGGPGSSTVNPLYGPKDERDWMQRFCEDIVEPASGFISSHLYPISDMSSASLLYSLSHVKYSAARSSLKHSFRMTATPKALARVAALPRLNRCLRCLPPLVMVYRTGAEPLFRQGRNEPSLVPLRVLALWPPMTPVLLTISTMETTEISCQPHSRRIAISGVVPPSEPAQQQAGDFSNEKSVYRVRLNLSTPKRKPRPAGRQHLAVLLVLLEGVHGHHREHRRVRRP
jgi:hypothetical protein